AAGVGRGGAELHPALDRAGPPRRRRRRAARGGALPRPRLSLGGRARALLRPPQGAARERGGSRRLGSRAAPRGAAARGPARRAVGRAPRARDPRASGRGQGVTVRDGRDATFLTLRRARRLGRPPWVAGVTRTLREIGGLQ